MLRSAVVLSFMMTGCALYVRPMDTLTPDDHVVLELNDQGIPDMAPRLGSGTFLVGGKLQSVDSTKLVMSVYGTQSTHSIIAGSYSYTNPYLYPPPYERWGGETVAVPKLDVASARVRRISGPLVALGGLLAVGVGVSVAEFISFSHHKPPTLPQIQTPTTPSPFPYTRPITLRAWPPL